LHDLVRFSLDGSPMKTKTLVLALALSLAATAVCLASPQMGTWKLNEAKSKLNPGGAKNITVVYAAVGDNVKITVDGIDKDGKPTHNEWTGKFDGKDYPVTGDPNSNARSYTTIDANTLEFVVKKDGKVTVNGKGVVAADGKSRTVTTSSTDAQGKKVESMSAYDKQ
jgi:phage gp45-like